MARGYYRTSDDMCLYCGHREAHNSKMPYKIGKGANKTYLCEKCFKMTKESKEDNIEKYRNV